MSLVDNTNQNLAYQLVVVYASKNCVFSELVSDLKDLLLPNLAAVVTGDFNFDTETNALTKYLDENNFTQIVNWPTHKGGRMIDRCYITKVNFLYLGPKFQSG